MTFEGQVVRDHGRWERDRLATAERVVQRGGSVVLIDITETRTRRRSHAWTRPASARSVSRPT